MDPFRALSNITVDPTRVVYNKRVEQISRYSIQVFTVNYWICTNNVKNLLITHKVINNNIRYTYCLKKKIKNCWSSE